MKWTLNEPQSGDVVRIKLGNIYHYGIYVNDEEIIQFGLPPTDLRRDASKVEVCISSLEEFLCGNFLEVAQAESKKERKKMFSPERVVERARERLGERGYHILYNNCEHFVNQCLFGKSECSQVEQVRQMWKNFPFVNIYVEKFPFETSSNEIFPAERLAEIEKCGNVDVRMEKFYDWKLLERGIHQSLGINIKNVDFKKNKSKWQCDDFEFSLSHGENIVAVAVARNSVGVDVELIDVARFEKFPPNKILTKGEMKNIEVNSETLNKLWTVKEALFKKGGYKGFNPAKIDTQQAKYKTHKIAVEGKTFYLSIASDDISFIKLHLGNGISLCE